jgi:GTP cyclohydrolase II
MKYKLYTVYEATGVRYYIVNKELRKVQSSWKDYTIARQVLNDLNLFNKELNDAASDNTSSS